ncbi:DUF3785 family protein [Clostridium grantii]|uniref:DUF3785 domain-containing protein n=1 Tax=Clostridium grantii DSM 8605 TaxID=1121316 RepID=A0A1M5TFL0_9CLOT|nr:DUF3785 family protein [Clostridium grantii]SHH49451.1 Protein of unknown function [Clostridium grantii DSM 8605]
MYKFNYNDKEYELKKEKCQDFFNDEEKPVIGFEVEEVLEVLKSGENVKFDLEYYKEACEACYDGQRQKSYKFLEYFFYVFTKDANYVTSSISNEYKDTSYNKLLKEKKVDNSYIVKVIVCENCGEFTVEVEECEI